MKNTDYDEIREIKAKRATNFFRMLSERRQITKELARKEREDREAVAKRKKEILADLQRQKEPAYRPPRPSLPPSKPPEPPPRPVAPHPATQDFLKWALNPQAEQEDETPPWVQRCQRIYGRGK